jgi:hypothetical protein
MLASDITQQRLVNQRIAGSTLERPADVVDWLGAVQAQDYAGARWALGMRMKWATDAGVEQAFADGSILRTHVLRPTWHFVSPADIRWLLALTAPRVHALNATMYRRFDLDGATLARSQSVLVGALQGGRQLTREELRHALDEQGITADNRLRLAYIMMAAELDGVICSGARRGKQFTYALLDERAPQARTLARADALAELARRYFASRGPASVQDFAKWSGLTVAECRAGLEAVQAELVAGQVDGQTYWLPAAGRAASQTSPSAYLLSIYDEYVSSYKDRSALGEVEVGHRLRALGNALQYIIVVDGQIVGTWKRVLARDAVMVETNLFRQLTGAENAALAVAARRYADYLELPLVLT